MSGTILSIILSLSVGVLFAVLGVLHSRRKRIDLETFVANRNSTGTGFAVASLVASIAGAWILFSPAETGTWAGITGVIGYGIGQGMPILVLIVFGSRLRKIMPRGYSLSGFIHRRYGSVMGRFVAILMIFYMFTFLTAELTGIAQAFSLVINVPLLATAAAIMILTLVYTVYGGLRSSIFTDFLQFLLIVPLLLIIFIAALIFMGGSVEISRPVEGVDSSLWNPFFRPGIEFAVVLLIAVTAANIFHQGFWQRVYACRDTGVMRRSFLIGGIVTIPVIILTGILGIFSSELGLVEEGKASVALFTLLQELPPWVLLLSLLLGLVLVMSSIDTLINGIVSILVTRGISVERRVASDRLTLLRARILTVVIAILAVAIASRGYSVLYLFLVADLVCSAVMFPALYGLYATRITGLQAMIASAAGLVAGALFFPTPAFASWSGLPANMLYSFSIALILSALLSVLFNRLSSNKEAFSFEQEK